MFHMYVYREADSTRLMWCFHGNELDFSETESVSEAFFVGFSAETHFCKALKGFISSCVAVKAENPVSQGYELLTILFHLNFNGHFNQGSELLTVE